MKALAAWKGKKVAVLGFGLTGMRVTTFLLTQGIVPTVFDDSATFEQKKLHAYKKQGVTFVLGNGSLLRAKDFDVFVRSPGIPLSLPLFKQKHKIITSQTKLFFDMCSAVTVGITGTKGKSTTARLLTHLLKVSGKKVYLTGNIVADDPLALLPKLKKTDIVVVELSSFQLEDVEVSPHIAIVLMVSEDHLDYHTTVRQYRNAKAAICKYQKSKDSVIFLSDYSATRAIAKQGSGKKIPVSGSDVGVGFDFSKFKPLGVHTIANATTALIACKLLKASDRKKLQLGIDSFKPLPLRLEKVRTVKGVTYINDSVSTLPDTAISAMSVFSTPLIPLFGGEGKGVSTDPLGEAVVRHGRVKEVVLFGHDRFVFAKSLAKAGFPKTRTHITSTLGKAFLIAQKFATSGDTVLFSPAARSYDQFDNYIQRGEKFNELVKGL